MKKVYLFLVLILGLGIGISTFAQHAVYGEKHKASHHTLNTRFGDIIYDQSSDEEYGGYIVSQYFTDEASANLTCETADDFVVPEGETWTIGSFGVWGTWWPDSPGNPGKIDIFLYEDNDGHPADNPIDFYVEQSNFYREEWFTGDEHESYYNFSFPSPLVLPAGHYWISFRVHDSYSKVGQWGWQDKTNTNWEPWHFRNPAGGFPGNFTTWTPSTYVTPFGYANDNRFALYGTSYNNDLATLAITNPVTGELTASETVTITIKNQGTNTLTGFDVAYQVNGGSWVVENVGSLELEAEESASFSFAATADLSANGFFTINAKTMLTGDEQPANDAVSADVVNYGTIYPMVNNDTIQVTTCSGTFTDMGGVNGMINSGDNGVITFYPGEAGKKIKLEFFGDWSISHTTNGIKPFRIFDGPDVNSPLIGEWTQNDWRDYGLKPEIIKALGPTGAITVRYLCPLWDMADGWTALVSCYQQADDDFAVTDFIIDPTLVFTDRDIQFTATVRNIGAVAQEKDVTFFVDEVPVGSVNTGTVNPTESTTVTFVYQFTTPGDKVIKAAVPEDSGEGDDNFKTVETFVYQNGWFIEMFDDGYFPPEDWTPGPSWAGNDWSYQGSGATSYVETFMEDTLKTPLLQIHEGDILTFYANTSMWWPGNLKVVWKSSTGGEWQLLEYIDLGFSSQFTQKQVDVSAAAGTSYLGFVNVGDVVWSWGSQINIDNVIGIGIEFFFFDNDMKMVEFNPDPTPSKNEPVNYEVTVKNNGLNAMAAGDYTVKIMQVTDEGDVEMASVPGIACMSLQEKVHTLTVTFDKIGPAEIYAVVELNGDQKPENNTSIIRPVYVQVDGTATIQIGEGTDESWEIPSPFGQSYTISEVIYPADLISPRDVTGFITGMAYQFHNYNTSPTLDVPIMIYVGETDEINLSGGFINGSTLTKVAETHINLPMGLNQQLYIPFTVPYNYQGGNLCVLFFKPMDNNWYSGVTWLGTNTGPDIDNTVGYTTSWDTPIDPENLESWIPNFVAFLPNTTFYIANVGTVPLNGFVRNEAQAPIEGALVEVIGFDNSTLSLANGSYQLNNLLAWETVVKASKYGYYDNPQNIVLYSGEANTLNFSMSLLPMVNVSATVVGNDDPMHYLEGAQVTLNGYENYSTEVGADGTFSIPSVFGDKTYSLTITYQGFDTYTAEVEVYQSDVDLGTIVLNESLLIPFFTQAEQINPGQVKVTWNAPLNGVADLLTYNYVINNGYTAEIGEEVWLGNVFEMEPGTITQVSMYWKQYGETSGTVRLDIVDVTGKIIYSSLPFETVHNGWVNVDVPNITFEGGTFYTMVYWDGTQTEFTDYLAADAWTAGTGINYGYIMYPGEMPHLVSDLIPDYDITFQMTVDIVTAAPETGRYNNGYNIFRGPYSDINNWASWQKINIEPVTGNEFTDGDWPKPEVGYTYGVQTIYTTGVSDISFSMPLVHDPNMTCACPWDFTVTGLVHTINIPSSANPNIYGEPLTSGDWIGVFYLDNQGNEVCGGAVKWMVFGRAVLLAYGDDPTTPEKDGFAAGEKFIWRILDCSEYQEYPAGATYDPTMPNQGNFADFGLSKLTSLQVMFCQDYTFTAGWNSISSYMMPFDPAVENLFAPVVDNLVIIRNLTSVYWPEEQINTIGNFDNNSGYVLKMNENTGFEICGSSFAASEVTLEAGWHYLPVLSECSADAMELFGAHLSDIVIIQDLIGVQVFWPAMGVYTLETLEPGRAYKIKVINPFTITFPDCAARNQGSGMGQVNSLSTPWGKLDMTQSSQVVAFNENAVSELQNGDFIGAFDQNSSLCGFMQIQSTGAVQVITLFADDITTIAKDGFSEGENISFRLYRAETGEEFAMDVVFDLSFDNATGSYYSNSLSGITNLSLSITGINSINAEGITLFPNPADDYVVITLSGNEVNEGSVSVTDTKGASVLEGRISYARTTLDISQLQPGIYVIRINTNSRNEISKLIVR